MININREYVSEKNTYVGRNHQKYIVVHETDNWDVGANAQRHAYSQAAGHLDTSVHYYCGSDGIYQAAVHSNGTYSVGREYGGNHSIKDANNHNTINIEICVNPDGDYEKARANAIELVKHLIKTTGIPAERVIRHYDAKGKYCPRRMMYNPSLWEDFKYQIGYAIEEPVEITEEQPEVQEAETWYRVGTGWANGICQNQTGAYHNLEFAKADCKAGHYVYDSTGKVVYSGGAEAQAPEKEYGYIQTQFVKDVQSATGSNVDGIPGDETIGNTITVSRTSNKYHAVVTPLERRLKALGYYTGAIEADEGKTPCFGSGMEEAVNVYQRKVMGYKEPDGEITAGKKMWKSLLGMI